MITRHPSGLGFISRNTASLGLAVILFGPLAFAVNVAEGPDFPNVSPGAPTVLTLGNNVFSGTLTTPGDGQDRFDVTIPVGLRLKSVTKFFAPGGSPAVQSPNCSFNGEDLSGTGTANFVNNYPLAPGNYSTIISAGLSVGNAWSLTFVVEPQPNYAVSTGSGFISITDLSGNSDALNLTNPVAGNIKFSAAGRIFSVNGGPLLTNETGNISLTGINDISVSCGNGNDTVNVSAFSGSTFPGLFISGGAGDDTVNLNGDITFASGNSLDLDLQAGTTNADVINVTANANLIISGSGYIYVECSKNISLASGSSLEVQDGDLNVEANQQSTPTVGDFIGVNLDGATLKSTGSGFVIVKGTGGDGAGSVNGYQLGVQVINGAKVIGGDTGYVLLTGTGGASSNIVNRGVTVYGNGSAITSSGGLVSVTGTAGPVGSFFGIGVAVLFGAEISAGGAGNVEITATGAGSAGSGYNQGLELGSTGSRISSGGGYISITGTAGPGGSSGIFIADSGIVSTPAAGGNIVLNSDSISIDGTSSVNTTNLASIVQLTRNDFGTLINLGGADVAGSPATLGLTDAELDRVQTANLTIGTGSGTGNLAITASITHPTATNITLLPGAGGVSGFNVGTNISLAGTVSIPFGKLNAVMFSTDPDPFLRLKVAGSVNLTGTTLEVLAFITGAAGNTFTIVDNDGADPIIGTFNSLPEGAFFPWRGSPTTLKARLSYVGGTGNDAVLTLVSVQPALTGTGNLTNGNWLFTGTGLPTNIYTIQATTNFITWTNIGSATGNVSGVFSFTDTNAFLFPYRFYRTTN